MNIHHYLSPIGCLEITSNERAITGLRKIVKPQKLQQSSNSVMQQCCVELDEYFTGNRKNFTVPLYLKGTDFQEKVWKNLCSIPYGTTISYAELAKMSGNAKAYRAAGSANGKNPIAIIVPCHRVINSGGALGGYAYGLEMKKQLLDLEKRS